MWLAAAVWAVLSYLFARLIGAGIRLAGEPPVPQLDDPLRRSTDLNPPPLAGAVLGLAYATDETSARYWLAVCARRGAPPGLLAELWATWQAEQERAVTYLPTEPEDRP